MSTPKMEVNNLISAVAVGNPQSVQSGTEAGGGNSTFMSLFAGVRGISEIKGQIPAGINFAKEVLTGSDQLNVNEEESGADEALSLLMGLQQPGSEGGKPLPEVGKDLPVKTEQEVVLPIAAEMTKERPFSMSKEVPEITLKPAVPADAVVPVESDLLSEHVTYVQPEPFSPLQPGIGYVPEEKLPSAVSEVEPTRAVAKKDLAPYLQTESEITVEAAVLPVMSPQQELTQHTPVKSAIDSIALQSVMEKDQTRVVLSQNATGPVLRTVLPEQVTAAITRIETGLESELAATAITVEDVVEEVDALKHLTDKKADLLMAATQNAKSIIAERATSLEAIQATGINELKSTSQTLSQVRNLAETVVLPETISMRAPNWNQNLGNNILWMVKEDLQSASIRVKPAELGPLNIQISVQQEQLQVSISAQHAGAREALEAALPRLREQFASQGFQQVNVDISQQQEQSTAGHQESDSDNTQNASGQASDSHLPVHETFSDVELKNYSTHDGLLDAFA